MITSTPASASSAATVAPPAPEPTTTTPHSRLSSRPIPSRVVSPSGTVMTGHLVRPDLGTIAFQPAPGHRRDEGLRVVPDLPLHLGQLVVAHDEHALEPPHQLGRRVLPGQ